MYYASFGVFSLIIHFIINYEIMKKPGETEDKAVRVRYRRFLFSLTLYYVVDILWGSLYGLRIRTLAYADTVLYFLSVAFSVTLWTQYVVTFLKQNGLFGVMITYAGWAIFVLEVLVLAVNFVAPIVFAFDETGEYHTLPARNATLAIQIVLFLVTSIYALASASRCEGKSRIHFQSVGFSGLIMTLFIILQTYYPLLPFHSVGSVVATCFIHSMVIQDVKADLDRKLGTVKIKAYIDPLTGVRNKLAYLETKNTFTNQIKEGDREAFGVVVFDIKDLKVINDTKGHDEGDKYIQTACDMICDKFKHSPVFRIGGDEFVALLEGEDYDNRASLLLAFEKQMEANVRTGRIVISDGMSVFDAEKDEDYDVIFTRADKRMYERKSVLKNMKQN